MCTYVWGFNGFQQISRLMQGEAPQDAAADSTLQDAETLCFSSPVWVPWLHDGLKNFVSTFDRIAFISGTDQLFVSGFRNESPNPSTALSAKQATTDSSSFTCERNVNCCHACGSALLFKKGDNTWNVLHEGETTHKKLPSGETNMVKQAAGTNEVVYWIFETGDLYQGYLTWQEPSPHLEMSRVITREPVSKVACGFEHTIVLSQAGNVYSSGSGSRGQLGHGILSVDVQHSFRVIEMLEGLCVSSISAGGWHSTAVTDPGDLYVWGWNESGQLGLPTGQTTPTSRISSKTEFSPLDGIATDTTLCHDCDRRTKSQCEHSCVSPWENKTAEKNSEIPYQDKQEHRCAFSKSDIPIRLIQNIEPVQVQTEPYLIDIPDTVCVRKTACGARHTAILLDSGCLLTAGWNQYGQLGQGHLISMDTFNTVTYFTERNLCVVDLYCSGWNMAVCLRG